MVYTSWSLFIFQPLHSLGECHCWWTRESLSAHAAKFYGRLHLIRSVSRASTFSVLKFIEIVMSGFIRHSFWLQFVLALLWLFQLFSAPEPKVQVHYCDHALSVVRPALNFHIFDFSSETTDQNSTKLARKQELNILYQVCVFRVDRKIKMAALASDWLRHFRLLLWNRWTEFNETWQEARSQGPLPQKGGILYSGARYVALWASCLATSFGLGSLMMVQYSKCAYVPYY